MDHCIRRSRRWFLALGFGVTSALSVTPVQAQEVSVAQDVSVSVHRCLRGRGPVLPRHHGGVCHRRSKGTTPTTFSPNDTVIRLRDDNLPPALTRSRANTHKPTGGTQSVVDAAEHQFDADDYTTGLPTVLRRGWRRHLDLNFRGQVVQVHANTGKLLGTWTGARESKASWWPPDKVFVAGTTRRAPLCYRSHTDAGRGHHGR